MANSQAKVIIKGENQIGSAVNSAKKDLTGFESVAQKCGDSLKKAFTATAVIAGIKTIVSGLKNLASLAVEDAKYMNQLSTALGGDATAFDKVNDKIDELEHRTIDAGDSIKALATELASMGKSEEDIVDMLEATASLSTATGVSIDTAYNALNSTLQGTATRLEKLGVDTSALTKAQLENGDAIQLTIDKYSELAKASAASSIAQTVENIGTNWGNAKESIGYTILYTFQPILEKIEKWTEKIWKKADEKKEEAETFRTTYDDFTDYALALADYEMSGDQAYLGQFVNATVEQIQSAISDYEERLYALGEDSTLENGINFLNEILVRKQRGVSAPSADASWLDDGGDAQALDEAIAKFSENVTSHIDDLGSSSNLYKILEAQTEYDKTLDYINSAYFDQLSEDQQSILKEIANTQLANLNTLKGIEENTEEESTTDPFSSLFSAGEMISGSGIETIGAVAVMFDSFKTTLSEMLTEVITPLYNTLQGIGTALAKSVAPILNAVAPILNTLGDLISTILLPIITALAKVFTVLIAPVQWLGDLFNWLGEWIKYLGSIIAHPFNKSKWGDKPASFESDAFSGLSSRLADIDLSASVSDSASSVGNASTYSGATTVHINIYMNSPVVGSNGMSEFAQMIRDEFERLDYYGVTA